ncbi:mercuric reductase [Shewanella eurypsychrophilus]|uniref:Mercuric reductase n=1 Tax=Shewanella eurypsychrophilus TaxID=2593656 RepID=A0ABX6V7M9_9GAMM|nr:MULTISPECIES: mercuric reductase [Shewanella]QFU23053.1 pyruvate/2-oxoglutarate dehydrogenase complex dihydrolipoamide dehydrogenase [Shewanella sp. YLB-09]QPG58336.1 mercuric reductase [Shewanella eurypsychrophilus]
MRKQYDLIWIGTGQATMSILPRALAAGKKVAVIEADKFGGTCVNSGCTPTKTLVAAARAIFQAKRGDDFGFSIGELNVDFKKVMAPQIFARNRANKGIEFSLSQHPNCTVFKGLGQFVDEHTVSVAGQVLAGEYIVINVGSRARDVDTPGASSVQWLNNHSLLDLKELPEHLAIVGGSYIGLEFAQIFRRFGSKVTVFERGPQLMFREDQDVALIAEDVLKSEGIDIVYQSHVCQVSALLQGEQEKVHIQYKHEGEDKSLDTSHILFAIGREPNSDRLNLSNANIQMNSRGFIEVNEVVQTNQPHIYAIGDVNGQGAFTHTSVNDGEIFWDHYSCLVGLNKEHPELDRTLATRNMIYAMFIDPPLARIGMNETEARKTEKNILIATLPMERIARAREKQETKGIVKILIDKQSEQIVGATVFGTGGDEVIGVFAAFMQTKMSYKHLRRTVFPHPTVGELMPWILDDLTLLKKHN